MNKQEWRESADRAAKSALDIYTDRDDVERELALHLARALRELDRCDPPRAVTTTLPGGFSHSVSLGETE